MAETIEVPYDVVVPSKGTKPPAQNPLETTNVVAKDNFAAAQPVQTASLEEGTKGVGESMSGIFLAEKKNRQRDEEWNRTEAAMDCVDNYLKQERCNETKDEDEKLDRLKKHLDLLTHFLEGKQSNDINSGNKVVGVQNNYEALGTLDDLVQLCMPNSRLQPHDHSRLESLKQIMGSEKLVHENGCPSPLLLKLMWEMLNKVFKLHEKGKTHGHLNPQSFLICEEGSKEKRQKGLVFCAKLSPDSSPNNGSEILEWQPPEQRNNRSGPTISADVYSLGRIFLYLLTGERPSDSWNTVRRKGQPSFVKYAEADDLISCSLNEKPELRPKIKELLKHALFWTLKMRLSFLRDTSERFFDSKYSNLRNELQNLSVHRVIGKEWIEKITDENVISYIMRQKKKSKHKKKSEQRKKPDSGQKKNEECKYKFDRFPDLVQCYRNMAVHYPQLPVDVQQTVGDLPDGFNGYFSNRFPQLLIQVYKAVRKCCKEDKYFSEYFSS